MAEVLAQADKLAANDTYADARKSIEDAISGLTETRDQRGERQRFQAIQAAYDVLKAAEERRTWKPE